jgi:hypothetical protein
VRSAEGISPGSAGNSFDRGPEPRNGKAADSRHINKKEMATHVPPTTSSSFSMSQSRQIRGKVAATKKLAWMSGGVAVR